MSNDLNVFDPASLLTVDTVKAEESLSESTECPRLFVLGDKGEMNMEARMGLVKAGVKKPQNGDPFIKSGDEYYPVPANAGYFLVHKLFKRGAANYKKLPGNKRKMEGYRDEVPHRANEGATNETSGWNEDIIAVLIVLDRDNDRATPCMIGVEKAKSNFLYCGGSRKKRPGLHQFVSMFSGDIGRQDYEANAQRLGITKAQAKKRIANNLDTFFVGVELITGTGTSSAGNSYTTMSTGEEFAPTDEQLKAICAAMETETFKDCVDGFMAAAEFRDGLKADAE